MSLIQQQNAHIQQSMCIITFSSYMFRHLWRHLQGGLFCMLKTITIVTLCDYTGSQFLQNHFKEKFVSIVKLKTAESLCKTL